MLFPLAQGRERAHPLANAVANRAGNAVCAAASMTIAYAWQAVAGGEAGQCVTTGHNGPGDRSSAADAGKITIAQFTGCTYDLNQGAGIDG